MSPHRSAPKPKTALSLRGFHALFPDEAAARAWFERARWPDGPVCPRCAAEGRASWMRTRDRWVCLDCKQQYSVMSFTPMHRSHLPLLVWAQAMYLILSSSKGVSSLKLSEVLGISYKAAWHLTQRIQLMLDVDQAAGGSQNASTDADDAATMDRMRRVIVQPVPGKGTFQSFVRQKPKACAS
jgi:transposase-like protein